MEVRGCTNCLMWHKYCKAACCKYFTLKKPLNMKKRGLLIVDVDINEDLQHYFELHGCYTPKGKLIIPLHKFRITEDEKHYLFHRKCDFLQDDLKCKGYPDKRPKVCGDFDPFNNKVPEDIHIPKLCVENFKEGENED